MYPVQFLYLISLPRCYLLLEASPFTGYTLLCGNNCHLYLVPLYLALLLFSSFLGAVCLLHVQNTYMRGDMYSFTAIRRPETHVPGRRRIYSCWGKQTVGLGVPTYPRIPNYVIVYWEDQNMSAFTTTVAIPQFPYHLHINFNNFYVTPKNKNKTVNNNCYKIVHGNNSIIPFAIQLYGFV